MVMLVETIGCKASRMVYHVLLQLHVQLYKLLAAMCCTCHIANCSVTAWQISFPGVIHRVCVRVACRVGSSLQTHLLYCSLCYTSVQHIESIKSWLVSDRLLPSLCAGREAGIC